MVSNSAHFSGVATVAYLLRVRLFLVCLLPGFMFVFPCFIFLLSLFLLRPFLPVPTPALAGRNKVSESEMQMS